jgi:predicted nucleic acid-binding protein
MARAENAELALYVSELVLAEVVWVLKSFYRRSATDIADVIGAFVSAPGIRVDGRETTLRALELARDLNVDYLDAVLALQAAARGETVCTFDETDFKRLPARWMAPE